MNKSDRFDVIQKASIQFSKFMIDFLEGNPHLTYGEAIQILTNSLISLTNGLIKRERGIE